MDVPDLSAEDRRDALDRAVAARRERAEVKASMKSGRTSFAQVLIRAEVDDTIAQMRVREAIASMPGVGRVRTAQILRRLGIAESRRLRGLGPHQKDALLEEFARG